MKKKMSKSGMHKMPDGSMMKNSMMKKDSGGVKKMEEGGSSPKPGTSAQIGAFLKDPRSFSVMKKGGSVGKTPMTPAQKKFAALAAPKNKITFADKIAGSKKKK